MTTFTPSKFSNPLPASLYHSFIPSPKLFSLNISENIRNTSSTLFNSDDSSFDLFNHDLPCVNDNGNHDNYSKEITQEEYSSENGSYIQEEIVFEQPTVEIEMTETANLLGDLQNTPLLQRNDMIPSSEFFLADEIPPENDSESLDPHNQMRSKILGRGRPKKPLKKRKKDQLTISIAAEGEAEAEEKKIKHKEIEEFPLLAIPNPSPQDIFSTLSLDAIQIPIRPRSSSTSQVVEFPLRSASFVDWNIADEVKSSNNFLPLPPSFFWDELTPNSPRLLIPEEASNLDDDLSPDSFSTNPQSPFFLPDPSTLPLLTITNSRSWSPPPTTTTTTNSSTQKNSSTPENEIRPILREILGATDLSKELEHEQNYLIHDERERGHEKEKEEKEADVLNGGHGHGDGHDDDGDDDEKVIRSFIHKFFHLNSPSNGEMQAGDGLKNFENRRKFIANLSSRSNRMPIQRPFHPPRPQDRRERQEYINPFETLSLIRNNYEFPPPVISHHSPTSSGADNFSQDTNSVDFSEYFSPDEICDIMNLVHDDFIEPKLENQSVYSQQQQQQQLQHHHPTLPTPQVPLIKANLPKRKRNKRKLDHPQAPRQQSSSTSTSSSTMEVPDFSSSSSLSNHLESNFSQYFHPSHLYDTNLNDNLNFPKQPKTSYWQQPAVSHLLSQEDERYLFAQLHSNQARQGYSNISSHPLSPSIQDDKISYSPLTTTDSILPPQTTSYLPHPHPHSHPLPLQSHAYPFGNHDGVYQSNGEGKLQGLVGLKLVLNSVRTPSFSRSSSLGSNSSNSNHQYLSNDSNVQLSSNHSL